MDMPLTAAQRTTLAAGIRASTDPTVVAALAIRDDVTLQKWCNSAASPAVLAWRTTVQPQESDEGPDYSTYDALAAGKRDSWVRFLAYARNFSRNKVRKWITDVWGNATGGSNAEAVLLVGTENTLNCEKILGQGASKTTGTVTAFDRTFVGSVSLDDVSLALNNNP